MHDLAIAALALRRFQHQHQIGRAEEPRFVTLLGSEIAERDREVRLTCRSGINCNVCWRCFGRLLSKKFLGPVTPI